MPTYPVIHKETKEKKELSMTMVEYDAWRKENPEWDKDWQAGHAKSISEVGDWRNKVPSDLQTKINRIRDTNPGSNIRGF